MTNFFESILAFIVTYYYYVVVLFGELEIVLHMYNGCISGHCEGDLDTNDSHTVPEIKYEDKYLDKFNQLLVTPLTNEKKDSLKNAFTMEYSPVGNIIMYYDTVRESFTYYCDNTVPYRYLEPVSRKYAIMFDCKTLHKMEPENTPEQEETVQVTPIRKPMKTKDIFSGFKTGAKQQPAQKIIVKETNRYTSMGRMSNFGIIKKVDRVEVDKNYKMTFSDFKKMKLNKT